MKSVRFLIISFLVIFLINKSHACGPLIYTPQEYVMYRVIDNSQTGNQKNNSDNCKEWQKLTSTTIPIKDINHVVYKMTYEEFDSVYNNQLLISDNKFIEWITKNDRNILDYLHLAKMTELIRTKLNSRWYYPSMKTGVPSSLEDIVEKALSKKGGKLYDRYLLQAIRAMFSLGKYSDCINLWESEVSLLPKNNLIRKLIQPYILGANIRLGNEESILTHCIETTDIKALVYYAQSKGDFNGKTLSKVDVIEIAGEHFPDNPDIANYLEPYIRQHEDTINHYHWENRDKKDPDFDRLYEICLKTARSKKTKRPALWYYTAAFMSEINHKTNQASYLLGLAEKSKSTPFIDESIKVFRIYLDAKLSPYDSTYESRLFNQLKWLDKKITTHITDNVINETANLFKHNQYISYYYWNDMMRKIVLGEVCPRMINKGKHIRALQLANMASYRLLNLVDKYNIDEWINVDSTYHHIEKRVSLSEYRYSKLYNCIDYSNPFFDMIDSVGVKIAEKYLFNIKYSTDKFDHFLNSRGYIDYDYLNDIIGTQYLRNMEYRKALRYLNVVSEEYKRQLNVKLEYDPWEVTKTSKKYNNYFRYEFAREMCSLEQSIKQTKDPNRKALLMFKMAVGISNSFHDCWSIVHYYKGCRFFGSSIDKRIWYHDKLHNSALHKAEKLITSALSIITDEEIATEMLYQLKKYRTIVEKYPETEKAKLIQGKCDTYVDYNIIRKNDDYRDYVRFWY